MPAAQRVQWAKFRVAATAFSALLILGVFLALLTGGTLFQERETLRVYMPDAAGIGPNAPVRLNGIPIGRITRVRLSGSPDPKRVVEVTFQIEHRYLGQVASDSVATTTSENIQGDQFLDITRGNSPVPLRPGAEVRFQPPPDVMKSLDLAQFERRMRAIDALLADIQGGKGPLGELLRKDDIYVDAVARLAELQKSMHAAMSAQQSLGRLLYFDTAYQNLLTPIRRLDQTLARLQAGEGTAGRLLATSAQYDDIRDRVGHVRSQLADLNAGKGDAGRFLKNDRMYRDWTRAVTRVIDSVDALNAGSGTAGRLLAGAEAYESLNGSLRELQQTLDDFRRHPQKYLRLKIF